MAQRAVGTVLHWALDSWAEEADLDVQVVSGWLSLTGARLRPFAAPPGLRCSGKIGHLSANWSWSSLLSSPATVRAQEVTLVIEPDPLQSHSRGFPAGAAEPKGPDAKSWGLFRRWGRQIWDRLQLEVSSVHIFIKYPCSLPGDSASIGGSGGGGGGEGAVGARGQAPALWSAGLFAERIAVSLDEGEPQGRDLQQTVAVSGAGAYIAPCSQESAASPASCTSLEGQLPAKSTFVVHGLSPCCRAARHSGRRFVDFRGLEVLLNFDEPVLSCTHEQYCAALQLAEMFRGRWREHSAAQSANRGDEAIDDFVMVEERMTPAPTAPSGSWWSTWFPSRGAGGARKLSEEASAEGAAPLMGSPPLRAATFELNVQLREASLLASDCSLRLVASTGLHLSCGTDSWSAEWSVSSLRASELGCPDGPDLCGRGSGGEADSPQLLLSARSAAKLEVSLTVAPLALRISPVVLDAFGKACAASRAAGLPSPLDGDIAAGMERVSELVHEVVGALVQEADEPPASPALAGSAAALGGEVASPSSRWSLTWRLERVTISVGPPWLQGANLLLATELSGSLADGPSGPSGAVSSLEGAVAVDLEDERGRRALLERTDIRVAFEKDRATASCGPLGVRCALHELVAMARAGLALRASLGRWNERPSGGGEGPAAEGEGLEVMAEQLSVEVSDDEASVVCLVALHGPVARLRRSSVAVVAALAELNVIAAGEPRALVRLDSPSTRCSFSGTLRWSWQSALEVLDLKDSDLLGTVAVHCPSVDVAAAWEATASEVTAASLRMALATLRVKTSEEFALACSGALPYISDVAAALCAEAVEFTRRPLGLWILEGKVMSVSRDAERLGVVPGSTLCAVEPPAEGDVLEHLRDCPMPVVLLLVPPAAKLRAEVSVTPFALEASVRGKDRTLQVVVEKAAVSFDGLQLSGWSGSLTELGEEVKAFYSAALVKELPRLAFAVRIGGESLGRMGVGAVGSSLAVLRFGGAAAGAVGCTLAKGVTTFATTSAAKGRELRGAEDTAYRFGDVTRGFLALSRDRGRRLRGAAYDDRGEESLPSAAASVAVGSISGVAAYARETRAVSTTLGAAIGGGLGAVAGPAGVVAGAAVGGSAMGGLSRSVESAGQAVGRTVSGAVEKGKESRGADASAGYRFGDLTRGLTAAGREARGGEPQGGYKFGDFSRGLMSKFAGR